MSAKYQATFTIPAGYPALLKLLTREILRAQPDNIYEFAARFFADLQANGGVPGDPSSSNPAPGSGDAVFTEAQSDLVRDAAHQLDLTHLTAADLEPLILKLFVAADRDHNGYLDRSEFEQVLRSTKLALNERTRRQILAEADEDEDNRIQYKEFLPAMVDLLQSIKAAESANSMMAGVDSLVRAEVEDVLLHGLAKHELEALMLKVFQKADADQSGMLSRKEFKNALRAAELGLTRRDINSILSQVDTDGDGDVSYREFIPVCFEVLVERFKDEIVVNDILNNQDGLQGLLLRSLQEADTESAGVLPHKHVKRVLMDLSYQMLGLSTLQIVTLLAQAPSTPDGLIQYVQFVPLASSMIYSMYDVDNMKLRLQAIKAAADAGGMRALRNMDIDGLRGLLEEAFIQADTEGTGQLAPEQVQEVLEALGASGSAPMLSGAHLRAMFAAIDTDESGTVDWNELVGFVCDTIEHIEREQYIQSIAEEQGAQSYREPGPDANNSAGGEQQDGEEYVDDGGGGPAGGDSAIDEGQEGEEGGDE